MPQLTLARGAAELAACPRESSRASGVERFLDELRAVLGARSACLVGRRWRPAPTGPLHLGPPHPECFWLSRAPAGSSPAPGQEHAGVCAIPLERGGVCVGFLVVEGGDQDALRRAGLPRMLELSLAEAVVEAARKRKGRDCRAAK